MARTSDRITQLLISVVCVTMYLSGLLGANAAFAVVVWEGKVSSGLDDWEQSDPGEMRNPDDSDLEMPYEDTGKGSKQIVGIRFLDVRIAKGARITKAYVEFVCDETKDGSPLCGLLIEGEASPNAAAFYTTPDIAGRARTVARAAWEPANWTRAGQVDRTSDISDIIEEIVNLDGWVGGNALALIISDNPDDPSVGLRCAESFDGSADQAPLLHIEISANYAHNPIPPDGTLSDDVSVVLSWTPGDCAVSHNVYLGETSDDVKDATTESDSFRGNQPGTFYLAGFPEFAYPDGLVPGKTYYWRIDEVNKTDPNSPWKGEVWSFSVPPKTAYYPNPADGAEFVDPDATLSWTPGFGAKLHTVYIGTSFDDVNSAAGGAPQAPATYDPGTLELEKVYYWRVDEFDAVETHKGDIWSFTTPGAVGNPQPANAAADVQMTATLSWTPADNAASHELYFGTGADAVKNATVASPAYISPKALGAESYDPGKLAWNTAYHWRVDEVYPTETVKGLVWSFTTANFLIVDDLESYNDIDPPDRASHRIFDIWIDGWGDPNNGSLVGFVEPPYVGRSIAHTGKQSMSFLYYNSGPAYYSEVTMTLTDLRDWTEENVGVLSLWFGDLWPWSISTPESMYVALANSGGPTAVVYHDDNPYAVLIDAWTEWTIDLEEFADQGVDLTNINTISIGFGDKNNPQPGGTGVMYFDDIRLYRPASQEPESTP